MLQSVRPANHQICQPESHFVRLASAFVLQPTNQISTQSVAESDKDRNVFALLGFLIGCLGIHQLYIGKIGKGIATIIAYCICPPAGLLLVGIDLLSTTADSKHRPLKDKDTPVAILLGILMILGGIVLFVISIQHFLSLRNN
ncbi:MAG: TM2 domain-containing protein [Lentisphaeria bacterium]|nr:TM2 domain-containing protein [Lentisphaeria bacterium]